MKSLWRKIEKAIRSGENKSLPLHKAQLTIEPLEPRVLLSTIVLENDFLELTVDDSGSFTMQRAVDDKWLLYPSPGTSAFSVKVDSNVYWTREVDDFSQVKGPMQDDSTSAHIDYVTPEGIRVRHEFSLTGEAVRFRATATNESSSAHRIKVRYLFDTQVDQNDGSPLYAFGVSDSQGASVCTYEVDIPTLDFREWRSYDRWPYPTLEGVGTLSTIPDHMVFAWWPDANDHSWDYDPDPNQQFYTQGYTTSPKSDSCVLVYFDMGNLPGGATTSILTNYGIGSPGPGSDVDAVIDELHELSDTAESVIRYNLERYADTFAAVIDTVRPDGGDYVRLGLKIFSCAAGIVSGSTPGDLVEAYSISQGAATLITSVTQALNVGSTVVGVAGFPSLNPDRLTEEMDEWANNNENFLLTATEESIAQELADEMLTEFEIFEYSGIYYDFADVISRIENRVEDYADALEADFTPQYPIVDVIQYLDSISTSLLGSQTSELVISRLTDDPEEEIRILGSPNSQQALVDNQIHELVVGEWWDWGLTAGSVGVAAVGLTKLALGVSTGGIATVAEIVVGAGLAVGSLYNSHSNAKAEEMAYISLNNLYYGTAQETEFVGEIVYEALAYLEILEQQTWAALDVDNSQVHILSGTFEMEDVEIPRGQDATEVDGMIRVTNNGSDYVPVSTYVNIYPAADSGGQVPEFPVMIAASDVYQVGPGNTVTINIEPTSLVGSTELGADSYHAAAYAVAGPAINSRMIGMAFDSFEVDASDILDQIVDAVTSWFGGSVEEGEQWDTNYQANLNAVTTHISLQYPGSDLDLHIYDSSGRHVGVNYETGQVENQIPGASYSGPQSMHEYISLPQSGGQQYSIVVTGLDTDGAEPFVVAVSDVPQRDGILAISPPIIRRTFDTSEGTQLLLELGAREIGGQASFQGLNASATNLSSDTSTINAVNISFDISSTMVPAGGLTMVTSTIDISPQLPVGTYTGSFYFGPDMLEVPVELEIVGALMPDLTIENISYTSGTYEAGDLITISGMQRNNGTADVPAGSAYLIALCLSQNQTWGDADDIEIYSAVENLSLGVNQSRTGNWSAEIPENALPGSYFVAGRIDNSTSIDELNEGNNLWWSNTADITIFEQPVDNITITKMTAKAGKTRGTWTDSFKITGLWDAQVSQLAEAEVITISVGSYQEMISLYDFHIMGKKPLFNYRGGSSGIKSAKLDLDKGIFNITAKNVDLTGLSAPVPIEIEVGNYLGKSYASEVVINGTKTLPFPFLAGYSDKAWIEKAAVKQGKANNVGNLVVSGSIATVDDVDLTTTALTIHWGTNSYDISPGYFINRGNKYMCKKKSYAADPVNAIVTMDFGKCTFKVVLKNTSMNWESSPVLFGLEFGSFNEFMAVTF